MSELSPRGELMVISGAIESAKDHICEGGEEHLEVALGILAMATGRLTKLKKRIPDPTPTEGGEGE